LEMSVGDFVFGVHQGVADGIKIVRCHGSVMEPLGARKTKCDYRSG
jgi:hypothetical protein